MGLRNTMVKRAGGANLATTVLNLTLTPLATLPGAGVASGDDLAQRAAGFLALFAALILRGGQPRKTDSTRVPSGSSRHSSQNLDQRGQSP